MKLHMTFSHLNERSSNKLSIFQVNFSYGTLNMKENKKQNVAIIKFLNFLNIIPKFPFFKMATNPFIKK